MSSKTLENAGITSEPLTINLKPRNDPDNETVERAGIVAPESDSKTTWEDDVTDSIVYVTSQLGANVKAPLLVSRLLLQAEPPENMAEELLEKIISSMTIIAPELN